MGAPRSQSEALSAGVIAISIGIPLGLLMGLSRWAKGVFDAPIEFCWPLPPLAYLPLMIIWLGIGETSKITLLTLAMLAPIILSAQAGVRALPMERVNAALSLGASRWQLFSEIVFPSALPEKDGWCLGKASSERSSRRYEAIASETLSVLANQDYFKSEKTLACHNADSTAMCQNR